MKKTISLFTLAILLLFATQSFAQLRFGAKAGLNLANMVNKDNDNDFGKDASMKPGFHVGVVAEYSLGEKFAIEPALLFSTKGFKYDKDGIKYTFNLNYLEIPINAVFKIPLGDAKLLIKAGPYFGYAISGKMKSADKMFGDNGDQTEQTLKIGSDKAKDDIKAMDIGVNIGAGVEIKSFTIGLQYGLGLANLSPVTDNGMKANNRVIGISVGYMFGGDK